MPPPTAVPIGLPGSAVGLLRVDFVTVRDFRGLTECTLALEPGLTLLVGRNGSGKSRLLRALALACGSVPADGDDFTVGISASPTIDLVLAPAGEQQSFDDRIAALFGNRVQLLSADGAQRIAWRTTISRSAEGWGGRAESRFMTYDVGTQAWVLPSNAPTLDRSQRGAISADLMSNGRDIAAELSRPGSAIRRILSDLDVPSAERDELQDDLQALSARIVDSSAALAAVRERLKELEQAVAGIGQPTMSPLPARLEELARTVEIALENTGAGPLPMRLHGSGARSLASLQVQSVLYDRHLGRDGSDLRTHPLTLAEEPEAHLHPQACFDLVGLLERMSGQVVVSTHSSHLVTVAPTEALRLVRQEGGRTVLRDLHPVDDEPTTPRVLRVNLAAEEWEKLKRLVERPFGELLFASAVVVGDGASEGSCRTCFVTHLVTLQPGSAWWTRTACPRRTPSSSLPKRRGSPVSCSAMQTMPARKTSPLCPTRRCASGRQETLPFTGISRQCSSGTTSSGVSSSVRNCSLPSKVLRISVWTVSRAATAALWRVPSSETSRT